MAQDDPGFQASLEAAADRYREVEEQIANPATIKDQTRFPALMQEHNHLRPVMVNHQRLAELDEQISGARELAACDDREMAELAESELQDLLPARTALVDELKVQLIPRDPNDDKNIIMEIRAGTGGDEAALFASDLLRMYQRYADGKKWKLEMITGHPTEIGGFKEAVFSITGGAVFARLRWESGVHRVQRVPVTESQGRIHTSAVTVAVLPEVKETDVEIRNEDLRIDVYRSSGPGGQSVNTTDSAVRITHLPTGLVVTCQDEKSQHKNKAKALRVLRARLYEAEEQKLNAERAAARRLQVGSGDRSERIRTYNFPQSRVTDHRINLTLYRLDDVLLGDLDEIVDSLVLRARESYLEAGAT